MATTAKLLIAADDFTGALDTGVQFAACGADVRVITDADADLREAWDCEVLVVDTESRHLSAEDAAAVVRRVAKEARKLGIDHIFKKTDSALRGNVGAELAALLEVSGERQLPFIPAFPQIGRITRDGVHYIDGVPVADSVFGQDPFEPVRFSRVDRLLSEQGCPVAGSAAEDGILIFDCERSEELAAIGGVLKDRGQLKILAGCAGFASVLPELLGIGTGTAAPMPRLSERFLVICGSVNPITLAQLEEAEAHGFARLRLSPVQKLHAGYWKTAEGAEALQEIRRFTERYDQRIIDTNDEGGNELTAACAAELGMTIEDVRQAVSRTVGKIVGSICENTDPGTMLVTGGDTLLQCMGRMGIRELRPLCELDHGVVLSRFDCGGREQYVITKSGGFGDRELLVRLAEQLRKS